MNRFEKPRRARGAEHGIVYRNDEEFCGWPFYCGLWRVANGDLVASFKKIPNRYSSPAEIHHDRLTVRQGRLFTIRSTDNGRSWDPASQQAVFDLAATADEIAAAGPPDYSGEEALDLNSRDVLVMAGAVPILLGPQSRAWMRLSSDGGRTWRRPILLPLNGLTSLTGHGSSMFATRADGVHLLGMSTTTLDGWTNRPLIYASTDGRHWHFLSFITPAIEGGSAASDRAGNARFGAIRHFYTRPICLRDGRVVASIRFQRDPRDVIWTDMFESDDGGRTWRFLSRVNDWGAPGDIVEMSDGRLVCVYGYRIAPQGIRYRVSEDGGRNWGSEIILRDDGGSWDLGYPRVLEQEKGKLLTVYYMNLKNDPIQMNGGVRHIAQTVFAPE